MSGGTNVSGAIEGYRKLIGSTSTPQSIATSIYGEPKPLVPPLTAAPGVVQGISEAPTNGLGSNPDAGFQKLGDQVGQVGKDVGTLNTNVSTGFTNLTDLVGTGFTANSAQMTDYQKNLMMGQSKLNDALTAASQKQDNYYTGLAAGQADIRGAVGGVQTGLNDFTNQYTKDAAQDLSDRRTMMTGMVNSTSMIRNDIGRTADSTQRSLMQSVGGVAPPAATPVAPVGQGSSAPVGGFVEQGPNQTSQILNSLNNARSILTTMGDRLDPAIRTQYSELVSAFDERGTLIPQAIDQSGAFVSRMMDGDSNLIVNKFNGSGQPLGRTGMNVNQMLAAADSFGPNAQPSTTGFMG